MKHTGIVTCFLLVLFFGAQVIGLGIINAYIDVQASAEQGKLVFNQCPFIDCPTSEESSPAFSMWYIIGAVIVGTLLILLIIKFAQTFLWKIWFYFAVTVCLAIALGAFIPTTYALLLALLLSWFKIFKPNLYVHNITELFIYGGLARIFVPILDVFYAFILLLALSVYDMYAVWHSKHMIKMAKFQTKSGIFAGLLLPYRIPSIRGPKKQVRTAVLGGGDIGFPLIFAGTVLVASGFLNAFIVALGATASLFILLLMSQRDKFYPAMPFLTLGCAFGYVITLLLL